MDNQQGDACVSVLVLKDNKVLLVLNVEEPNKSSKWGMPRGRRDPGDEADEDVAFRETYEEVGLQVEIDHRYRVEEILKEEGYYHVAFLGYPFAGKLKLNEELLKADWFPVDVLWITDRGNARYLGMHPRQRRMAQELMRQKSRG